MPTDKTNAKPIERPAQPVPQRPVRDGGEFLKEDKQQRAFDPSEIVNQRNPPPPSKKE
jgi:hypothetical protein